MMVTMTEKPREVWSRCETCDTNGPELPTLYADWLEFHRATHFAGRMIAEAWHLPQLLRWLIRS